MRNPLKDAGLMQDANWHNPCLSIHEAFTFLRQDAWTFGRSHVPNDIKLDFSGSGLQFSGAAGSGP
jgi:hypothetical protein